MIKLSRLTPSQEQVAKVMKKWTTVIIIVVAAIFIFPIVNPFVIIPAGERGVMLNWGAVSGTILDEGLHFRIPVYQQVVKIDVKTLKIETKTLAYSRDIQTVNASLALNYNVKAQSVNRLWQEVGKDFQSRLIDPAIQESVKAGVARFTAQELIEERPKVKDSIKEELLNRLSDYFNVVEFSITDFSFSDEYEKAVESKQVSQQQALKAKNDLDRVKLEAEQRVAQAEAEAKAIQIQAEAITQQGGREYVNLKAVEKWDGKLPAQMIPDATLPFINLNK
jgi:regulator of protease activity HflC (stomatin/prohibitin superfamily)